MGSPDTRDIISDSTLWSSNLINIAGEMAIPRCFSSSRGDAFPMAMAKAFGFCLTGFAGLAAAREAGI